MTVKVALAVLPAPSRAVTVSTLVPDCNAIPLADQLVVPLAVPLPPWLLLHVTWVTPMVSDAVPPSVIGLVAVVNVAAVVGLVMATVGAAMHGQLRRITPVAITSASCGDQVCRIGLKLVTAISGPGLALNENLPPNAAFPVDGDPENASVV